MIVDKSSFKTNDEYIAYMVANKKQIIALKKAATKYTDSDVVNPLFLGNLCKSMAKTTGDDLVNGIIKRTIIANTYNWMDSHLDVHIKGIFTKSVQENKNNILHLHDHIKQLTAKVGTFTDIYEKDMLWTDLGVSKEGYTTCLMCDSDIKRKYNELIYDDYLAGNINQHSVCMQYVKMVMCVNDPKYKEEFADWNKYISLLGNPDRANKEGVFFAQLESKLSTEISCVIAGSNELTRTLEPSKITPHTEPEKSTQSPRLNYGNLIKHLTPSNQ